MPAQPIWYPRIPEILEQLNHPGAPPFLDRPAIERLFRISRRQAIRILGHTNGYQVGKTFLVDRAGLVHFLQEIRSSGAVGRSLARKDRIAAALNEAVRHAAARDVEIRPRPQSPSPTAESPTAVQLTGPGKIEIHFRNAEDLLAQIVDLVTAATTDFPSFRRMCEGG
jgi:hypothetical protein